MGLGWGEEATGPFAFEMVPVTAESPVRRWLWGWRAKTWARWGWTGGGVWVRVPPPAGRFLLPGFLLLKAVMPAFPSCFEYPEALEEPPGPMAHGGGEIECCGNSSYCLPGVSSAPWPVGTPQPRSGSGAQVSGGKDKTSRSCPGAPRWDGLTLSVGRVWVKGWAGG